MRKLILAGALCLIASACQTPQQAADTTTGVVAGAAVGGPVGARWLAASQARRQLPPEDLWAPDPFTRHISGTVSKS